MEVQSSRHLAPASGTQVVLPQSSDLDLSFRTRLLDRIALRVERRQVKMRAGHDCGPPTAREFPGCGRASSKRPEIRCLLSPETFLEQIPERKHGHEADEAQHEARPHADAFQPHERLADALGERVI